VADAVWWVLSIVAGLLPERVWPRLDLRLPLQQTAFLSGIATLSAGFFVGVAGFMRFLARTADANNAWMLKQLAAGACDSVALGPYVFSVLSLFYYLFLTPLGLFCTYLVVSGSLRAISGFIDDPRGDFVLSISHWAATTAWTKNRDERARIARGRLEGAETPDVLQTGAWAGIDADYVVLAARRKAEWNPGAIVMTSGDWYKLGAAFDIETPAGLRTAYPLTKMDVVEVVRRGIQYELPRLVPQSKTRTPKFRT
jgi:hypothetical protein